MKKTLFALTVGVMMVTVNIGVAQLRKQQASKNFRKSMSFEGRKTSFRPKAYNAIGFSVNALNYFGDLAPLSSRFSSDISFTRPGFAFSYVRRFGPRYSMQTQFMWGTLSGSDQSSSSDSENGKYRYMRNLSFRNQIKELSVVGYFDLFANHGSYIRRVFFTPYVYGGLAVFLHNPQAKAPNTYLDGSPNPSAGKWINLHDLGTEGQYSNLAPTDVNYGIKPYSLVQIAVPVGAGIRMRLNDLVDVWADIGFRYTFTDYLDDVSHNYVNLSKLNSPLAQAMSYRTNELFPGGSAPNGVVSGIPGVTTVPGYGSEHRDNMRGYAGAKDIYMVTNIKMTYIIGSKLYRSRLYTSRAK